MIPAALRKHSVSVIARAAAGTSALVAVLAAAPAHALDSPTAVSATEPVQRGTTGRQLWRLSDYSTVELVAREAGAAANQHPAQVEPNTLHALLQQVQIPVRNGLAKPLFAIDELNNIVPALVSALANARADQDVALVSSARHEDNTFYGITAVTARLFFVDGRLNLIVHDARQDFYDAARGSGIAPRFTVGSRTAVGSAVVQSASGTNQRADWLVLASTAAVPQPLQPAPLVPLVQPAPPAPAAPAAPAAVQPVAPAAPVPPPVVAPVPPAAPALPAPAGNDPEQRLLTLKRLYDKGLISKSEYEKKRQEIIKGL
jgi:hypothetical protein